MSDERKEEEHAQDLTGGAGGPSTPEVRRAAEEDLAPGLKAVEAELASLSPRTDRIDRERLIFLAGQQSVAGGRAASRARRWGWPTAFAAMTALAAGLLVALLLPGEPRVVTRVVTIPVAPVGSDAVAPNRHLPPPSGGGPEALPETVSGTGLLAWVGLDWSRLYDRERFGSERTYPGLLDRALRDGVDSLGSSLPVADVEPRSSPATYRELLDSLLENRASDEPAPAGPLMPPLLYPGANS